MTKTEDVREIQGQDILEWLRSDAIKTYKYVTNRSALWLMFGFGLVTLVFAVVLAVQSKLDGMIYVVPFMTLLGFTSWAWMKLRWGIFSLRHYIGISDKELLFGDAKRAMVVSLSALNSETLLLEEMKESLYNTSLPLRIGSFVQRIHLIGLYAHIDEVEDLIERLLVIVADQSET